MNMDTLSIFLTVAEEMNFTKAARKLFMTQQSLSGHIKRLEAQYGTTLFERKPVLKLTPEGEVFVFYARQMLSAEKNLINTFADISEKSAGYLDMGISHQRSGVFFEDIWGRFHRKYPNIDIRLREENTASLLGLLQEGEISLMVGVDVPTSVTYQVEVISSERMCCIVSSALLERYYPDDAAKLLTSFKRNGVHAKDVSQLPLIVLPEGNRFRNTLNRLFRNAGLMPRIVLESNCQDLSLRLALRGEGMAFLSPTALYNYFRENKSLPDGCFSFDVPSVDENIISIVSPINDNEPGFISEMKRSIKEAYKEYNKIMGIKRKDLLVQAES